MQAGQQEGLDDPADDYTGPRTLDGTPAGPSKSNHPPSSASRGQPPRRTGIATLGSGGASAGGFRQGDSDSEKDNHTDDDHDPDLYAGGGRSGLNIEDPNKRKGGRKLVENILKKAAECVERTSISLHWRYLKTTMVFVRNGPIEQQTPSQSGPSWFGGSGNTLGSDETPSQFIPSAQSGDAEDLDEEEKVTRHLTLWANGFSVDDGPLLSYQEHQSILQDLSAGRAPLHLLNVKFGQRVDLQVQKRTDEEYVAPKPTVKPFGGEGNRLGAPTPQASTSSASSSQPPAADRDTFMTHTKFELDHSQPITSIQIRLGTGERYVSQS